MDHKKTVFDVDSPLLQGHPLSKVDMDDTVDNGRHILAVVRPGLLGFEEDDTQGVEGEQYRVLAKAIVLLDEKR